MITTWQLFIKNSSCKSQTHFQLKIETSSISSTEGIAEKCVRYFTGRGVETLIGFTSLLTTAVHRLCEKYHKLKVVIHYSGGFPGLIDGLFIGGYLSVAFLFSLKLENI